MPPIAPPTTDNPVAIINQSNPVSRLISPDAKVVSKSVIVYSPDNL